MDSNRDEGIKCIKIAKQHIQNGNVEKAEKFLLKAEKLYPTPEAKNLLEKVRHAHDGPKASDKYPSETPDTNGTAEPDETPGSTGRRRDPSGSEQPSYTKDQVESVRRIRKSKDYYEILGITKESSEDDLKKAYRKLALKFHPDKNKAPGATEAFKAIGNAFAVLSDPDKKRRYDQFGTVDDSPQVHRHSNGFYEYDFSRGFESEVSPEELFNMFFGGGFPSGHVYRHHGHRARAHNHHNRDSERENRYFVCLQLLPLFILFAMSFFSGLFVRDPYYSLHKSEKYPNNRHTTHYNIPFFVKNTFHQDYTGSLPDLEREVEEEYINNIKIKCYQERQYKESLIFRARYYGDQQAYQHATNMETPYCDRLTKIFNP